MIRRILGLVSIGALVSAASCNTSRIGEYGHPPPLVGFDPADAGGADAEAESSVTKYCPVTTCALPWATCASSKFPC
ncbi:MAG: hypothetical protein K0S65_3184, partial [Labilithrix sp.]|nr:hypothetical protein [Labilithrix sp.]